MLARENGQQIKRELYKSYLILVRNLYLQSKPDLVMPYIGTVEKRFLVGSVIFLAFAMEAFINDFGDKYVEDFEDLEKMETLKKFLLFPRISREKPLPIIKKNVSSYIALKELFRYRNYFVHYKPAFRGVNTRDEILYTELNHKKVKELYGKMIKLLKLLNNHFKMFKDGGDWINDCSEDITAGA